VINAESIDLILQRPIDWSRQAVLATYLATTKTHKFPPILVVLSKDWVDNPEADEWGGDGRAVRSVADFSALDNSRRVGLLDTSPEYNMFALDGQHRLIGIRGLMQLIRESRLQPQTKEGKPKGEVIELDELLDEQGLSRPQVQALSQERIGIEFISAVMAGETREEAHDRVASIFVHVNMTAAPLSEGQLAQLDQDNGFAIVARQQAVSHELLKSKPGRKPRVNFNSSTVAPKATVLTTLQTLKEMVERYIGADPRFDGWKPAKKRHIANKPPNDELEDAAHIFVQFLDHLAELPSYQEIERGADTGTFRRFSHEKNPGEGHMLFRPIGQIALAQAVGYLHFQRVPAASLDDIFKKLKQYDDNGGFRMDDPSSLWYAVLYDPLKKRMSTSGRDLAARLLQYVVGGGLQDEKERETLRSALAQARATENGMARGFDGKEVPLAAINLPPVL
jgi:DGQHR domain-containing protein